MLSHPTPHLILMMLGEALGGVFVLSAFRKWNVEGLRSQGGDETTA